MAKPKTRKVIVKEADEGLDILTHALDLLDTYDHKPIEKPGGRLVIHRLDHEECHQVGESMRFVNDSRLFGDERQEGALEAFIDAICQEVFGNGLCQSPEDKASHLLYFLVKGHPSSADAWG